MDSVKALLDPIPVGQPAAVVGKAEQTLDEVNTMIQDLKPVLASLSQSATTLANLAARLENLKGVTVTTGAGGVQVTFIDGAST